MKKMLFTLTVLASAFCALTFTSCGEKKSEAEQTADKAAEQAGNVLDKAADTVSETVEAQGN